MELARVEKFYRNHSRFYDATRWMFLPNHRKAVKLLGVNPGDTVIDFACGTGLNIPYLLREGADIIGIDYSAAMLGRAKSKFSSVKFIREDIVTCNYPGAAGKIICTYALSMIENWEQAILNMKRTLRKDGVLVILDFHPLKGALKGINPCLGWWLNRHGVDAKLDVIPFLRTHFSRVEAIIPSTGYCYMVKAELPFSSGKPEPHNLP